MLLHYQSLLSHNWCLLGPFGWLVNAERLVITRGYCTKSGKAIGHAPGTRLTRSQCDALSGWDIWEDC